MKIFKSSGFILVFLWIACQAKAANGFYSDSTIVTKIPAYEDEKQAIANAINKYLDAAGIRMTDLAVTNSDDGGKEASGNVSFFGFDNINLKASLSADHKVKSISTVFPDAASITPDKLAKFLSGRSLNSFLPKSFPLNTAISVKDLVLNFDDKGDSLSKVSLDFGIGSYVIDGFDGFSISGMTIGFVLDKPTSPQRKASATIAGDGKIGAIPINLSATMSSDPDDLLFSFTATGINISSLLNSFMSESKANRLLKFIPDFFKSKQIDNLTASFNPTNKNFIGLVQSSFGEAEIQFNGASEESKSTMLFGIAPPAGFKFSNISNVLAPMDGIGLSGTALIISSLADPDAKSSLAALKDEGDISIQEGVNIFSTIKLPEDLSKFLKNPSIKLRGAVNETFTNMSLDATLHLGLHLAQNVTMQDVNFGVRLGVTNPVEFTMGGLMEAKVGNDLLGFNANFAFSPISQQISGEFYMAALQKMNGARINGKLGSDGKSDLPEWTNPLGLPGVGLQKLGVSAGIDFKNPLLLTSLGIAGAARFGIVSDHSKHVFGDVTVVLNLLDPTKNLVDIKVKNLTPVKIIEAYVENASIGEPFRTILSTGFDSAHLLVVPVDGVVAFGKTYNKGVSFGGIVSIGGIKGYADFSMNENGIRAAGSMDAINWGNGAFLLQGRTTNKPQFNFAYTKGSTPTFFIDGKISLLGISSETTAALDASGFSFTTTGKIANVFEATLEGKGSFTESSKGIYVRAALRSDLVSQLNQLVTGKINSAIQTTKTTLQNTRNALTKAQNDLKSIDAQILARTKILQGQKAADVQKIRDEAIRQMNEKQAFINTCLANNAASQKRINELTHWYDAFEKGALYTAIEANNAGIESAKAAYAVSLATVNATADVVEAFPNDPVLIGLYAQKVAGEATLKLAFAGVDIAEGVSVTTLEATKFVLNGVLGGVFDIKSAEFAGTFGLNNQYKINTALNFTLANNPYNIVVEIDFANLGASAEQIAKNVLGGTLIKPGFASTFAADLKRPVTNMSFASTTKSLSTGNSNVIAVTPIVTAPVMNIPVTPNKPDSWGNSFYRIENLWQSGQRINIEKGPLVSTVMFDGAWSAQWVIKPVPGTNYYWIENRWKGGRLHVENGSLECSVIKDGAWSAHWDLKKIGPNLYWIENRWKTGQRINVERGMLECSTIQDGANSAMWYIRQALDVPQNLKVQ